MRYEASQQWRRQLKAWIRVDLNKPGFKVLVYHKVKPKQFKIISQSFLIHNTVTRPERFGSVLFHFWQNLFKEIVFLGRVSCLQIFLEVLVGKFVSFLVFTVVSSVFLNSIVCQMN
jgi:hypothetical protein